MALTKKVFISDFTVHPNTGRVTLEEQIEILEDDVSLGRLRRSYRTLDADINNAASFVDGNTYDKGDVISFNSKVWICNADATTVSPDTMTAAEWTEIPQKSTTQKLTETVKQAMSVVTRDALEAGTLTPEEQTEVLSMYPNWKVGMRVAPDDVINFNGTPYKCIQGHVTQADWTPDIVPALWGEVSLPGQISDWVQPTGAHDAYDIGDQVLFEGSVYESTIDANTYSPTDYPAGWTLIE